MFVVCNHFLHWFLYRNPATENLVLHREIVMDTCVLLLMAGFIHANSGLVGPGAVTGYTGQGSRRRSYGYVRDPAAGFFVGGSTIKEMNGVYVRKNPAEMVSQ